jgi:hypothetical protein
MTDEIVKLNTQNELIAENPSTGNTRPVTFSELELPEASAGDSAASNRAVATTADGTLLTEDPNNPGTFTPATDGRTITPSQVGTSTDRSTIVADSVDTNSLTGVSAGGALTVTRAFLSVGDDAGTIPFDSISFDPDSNFDTSTGKYTAPSDGIYRFNTNVESDSGNSNMEFFIQLNDSRKARTNKLNTQDGNTQSVSTLIQCVSGDTVSVQNALGEFVAAGDDTTYFEAIQLQ